MSSDSVQDIWFVEVSQITITASVSQPKFWPKGGDYRVAIKHEHGTEETIPSSDDGAEVIINCKTFIQMNSETTIHIHRAKKFDRDRDPSGSLKLTGEEGKEYAVDLEGKPGMAVTLKLGDKMTMAQVADARVTDANEILGKQTKSAEDLERVTGHVKLLLNVAKATASVNKYANAAVSIAKLGLEKIEEIPAEYRALKDIALDCINHIKFDKDARQVYMSDVVIEQLNSVMSLVIEALEFIFHHYSQSRIRRTFSKAIAPSGATLNKVKSLASKLEKAKGQIKAVFDVEIRDVLQTVVEQTRPSVDDRNEPYIPMIMQEKEGWDFVDNVGEEDPLKRFLGTIGGITTGKDPCLPGTRISILDKLSLWAQDDSQEAPRLFWLYGVAGCGKSAVAASICKILNKADRLTGSFFCRRDEVGRRNPVQLFGHLASCLAKQSQDFSDSLVRSLEKYANLDFRDKSTFIEYVLKDPLSEAVNRVPSIPIVFVVDALDECNDSGTVARFLAEIVAIAPWMRLIVTSREEPDVKKAFVKSSIPKEEHDLFEGDARSDVLKYLHTRLDEMQDLDRYIDELADRAGGLFIWLHTVTEVIRSSRAGREANIRAFLDQPLVGDAEGRMAAMYLTVLQQASRTSEIDKEIVRAIAGLLLATSSTMPLTISGLYAFLPPALSGKASLDEFGDVVFALKPVLKLTPAGGSSEEATISQHSFYVQTHHASFLDFCSKREIPNKSASGVETTHPNPFWTDSIALHRDMAMGCLQIMNSGKRTGAPNRNSTPLSGLKFNICGLNTSYQLNSEVDDLEKRIASRIPQHLLYSCLHWASHVFKSSLDERGPANCINQRDVQEAMSDFLETTRSLFWLEVLSLTEYLLDGQQVLINLSIQRKTRALLCFSDIASEMCRFVEQCFSAIASSTPHLYISLAWLPVDSQLWAGWKNEFSGAMILKDPTRQSNRLISWDMFPVRVDTFAVSLDGQYIVSGSTDGYVRLWYLGSLHEPMRERQISPGASPIGALACALDGSHILCACNGLMYKLDTETLNPIGEGISIRHTDVRCMAISETHTAFGKEDGRVVILDAKTFHEDLLEQPGARTKAVDAIALSPDGIRLVYIAGGDTYVCAWDEASRSYRHVDTPLGSGNVTAVAFSQDGKDIATGESAGHVRLFNAESGENIGGFRGNGIVQFLTLSHANRIICAFGNRRIHVRSSDDPPPSSQGSRIHGDSIINWWVEETRVEIWDVDFSRGQQNQWVGQIDTFSSPENAIATSVSFSPDGTKIVSGSYDYSVRVWDAQTGKQEKLAEMKHSLWVEFVTFSPDGKSIASGGADGVVRIWDAQTGKPVRVLKGLTGEVTCGAYSPDGATFVSGSNDKNHKTLRMWDIEPKKKKVQLRRILHPSRFRTTHDENSVFSGHEFETYIQAMSVSFSPDGSCFAVSSSNSTIHFWDAKTRKALGDLLSVHDSFVSSIAFSPDGHHLVSGGYDKTVQIWDVETRTAIGVPLQGHTDSVYAIAYSPDGAFIFSASQDGTIRCWDAITGNPVGYPVKEDCIYSVAVSPDGDRIVSGSSNGCIRVWDSQPFKWELVKSFMSCGHRGPQKIPDYIPDDGWIRTAQDGLLLWVPEEHREAVCRLDLFTIVTNDTTGNPIPILWDELCHGEKWMDIRNVE